MPLRNAPTTPLEHVPVTRETFEIQGSPTAVWTYGGGTDARTVILVHGFRGTHHGLLPLVAQRPEVRFIAPDLPGFGESTSLPREHTLDAYADWLRAFATKVDPDARATVLGHSFGSLVVARDAAALAPRDIVLVNPIAENALSGPSRILTNLAIGYYRLGARLPEAVGARLLTSPLITRVMSEVMATTRDRGLRRWIHDQHAQHFSEFADRQTLLEAFRASVSDEVQTHAAALPNGVTLISGERDTIATVPAARRLQRAAPGATLHVIDGVGHLIHYERPITLARLLDEHLATHPPRNG